MSGMIDDLYRELDELVADYDRDRAEKVIGRVVGAIQSGEVPGPVPVSHVDLTVRHLDGEAGTLTDSPESRDVERQRVILDLRRLLKPHAGRAGGGDSPS